MTPKTHTRICHICGNTLINAIDAEGAALVLVHNPKLYGLVWGHHDDINKDGDTYELVRPLLGARQLHADVCKKKTLIEEHTDEWA